MNLFVILKTTIFIQNLTLHCSRGPNWGEDGYIRVKRESTEVCGFDSRPQDGVGCHGQTDTVRVCGMCGILYDTVYPIGVYKVKNSDESMGNSLEQFLN